METIILGPGLQNISQQSYDYLTITPKLPSTYDGRPIHQAFLGTIHLQDRKIVWDSVRKSAYDIPKRIHSTL